jgi:formamidopyrimidine-DNA glycosylase
MVVRIKGQTITSLDRRGKYILLHLSGEGTLIVHLRMSGHLAVVATDHPRHKHEHTILTLAPRPETPHIQEELRFRDQRKFGRLYLVQDPVEIVGKLGPEPLDENFSAADLQRLVAGRKRQLKPFLLDQSIVAGIGNIYADEALFYAGLHPLRQTDTLTEEEVNRLYTALRQVLLMGIEREGASIDLYVKPDGSRGDMQNAVVVFRRQGLPCFQCGRSIVKIRVGGRGTHYCAHCQPLPEDQP